MKRILFVALAFLVGAATVWGQETKKPNPFDYGKMWTFENPPKEWFKKEYGFEPDDKWFDDVRKSSLKFASWCSASFISPDGLIMTNHHCSRDVVAELQKDGENFDKQGFYASTLAEERKAEGLFVEQLINVADVTSLVKSFEKDGKSREEALAAVEASFASKKEWEGLRLQMVTYYSGGKFSLYGLKRYEDIRLVWIPELDLGFYGGDPDNFTYPRYNLDATLWRAYDENGKPLNTSSNYFKFNAEGAKEGEPVFVIGNPGRTERYRTVSQLTYDRDYRYPMTYKFLKNRSDALMEQYNGMKDDPAREYEAQALLNQIASVANGMKAYGGIVGGLKNDALFKRKVDMENYIRKQSPGVTHWDDLEKEYTKLNPHGWAITHLSPSGLRGNIYVLMHVLKGYKSLAMKDPKDANLGKMKEQIKAMVGAMKDPAEIASFSMLLNEIKEDIYPSDTTLKDLLKGQTIAQYIQNLTTKSKFSNVDNLESLLGDMTSKKGLNDPMMESAEILVSRFEKAGKAFSDSGEKRKKLEEKIANQVFKVYGSDLPPDATFTLRISDGVIKAYDYNGTKAPAITTYYGLYDRHYSHNEVFPWSLPERWLNPSLDLLRAPLNTVSTNDIIGGNSGSPLINKDKEAVGLIFDGNIESLPGNFIFDETANRTVSVHAGGIMAALKYIYKADRIVNELSKR